jgi:hypothetical protein
MAGRAAGPAQAPSRERLRALKSLRTACRSLSEDVEETESYGNPAFKCGKRIFAVLDRYDGADCLWLRVLFSRRGELLKTPGWFASPYDPMETALCCRTEAVDWRKVRALLRESLELCRNPRKERQRF